MQYWIKHNGVAGWAVLPLWTLLILLTGSSMVSAQGMRDAAIRKLTDLGMLQVRVLEQERHLLLGLEQGRYRFAPRGLSEVYAALSSLPVGSADTMSVIVYSRGLALLHLQQVGAGPLAAGWESGQLARRLESVSPVAPSVGRVELLLSPGLRYQLGNLDLPAQAAVDLQAGLDYLFRPGWSLQGMIALPAFNNLDEKTRLRLERAVLVRDLALRGRAYISMAAGIFSHNRAGGHFSGRLWLPDERFSLRVDAGLTGFTRWTGPVVSEAEDRQAFPVLLGAVEYRWRKYELNIRMSAGRFLYQDDGIALEVFRQMGEYRTGFFGTVTTVGTNIGFQLSLPLFPARYSLPGRFRVRVTEQFPFTYRYRGLQRDARRYTAGNMLVDQLYGYYPRFFLRSMAEKGGPK